MAVDEEAGGDIGLEFQDDIPAKEGGSGHEQHGSQVAGAQESDSQKGHEEDQRRAEIAHKPQTAHAEGGENQGEDQVALGEHLI